MVFRKIRSLKPSLREKKRYVVFEILSKGAVRFNDSKNAIQNAVYGFLGMSGAAKLGLMFFEDTWKRQKAVVRVSHKYVEQLKASFCFVNHVGDEPVICRSVGVSGILNKAVRNYTR